MENLVTIKEVGAYSERQYQKQDGTTEYFKSRGVVMKRVMRTRSTSLTFNHYKDQALDLWSLATEGTQELEN